MCLFLHLVRDHSENFKAVLKVITEKMKVRLDFPASLCGWWGHAGLGTHTEKFQSGSIPFGQNFSAR